MYHLRTKLRRRSFDRRNRCDIQNQAQPLGFPILRESNSPAGAIYSLNETVICVIICKPGAFNYIFTIQMGEQLFFSINHVFFLLVVV
nr:MAG TPA: hypothetical protein [Caudoviricetes sp.]